MDIIKELYDLCYESQETEESLIKVNKELLDYIESNIPDGEKVAFFDAINPILRNKRRILF